MGIAGKPALTKPAAKTSAAVFIIAFVAGVLLASAPPAFAQGHKGSAIGGTGPTDDPTKKKKRDDEEKAAKAAMERVPDSKAKYDPWKIER